MKNKIESPLNYTGNKYRILDQILPLFPKNINKFFDICCGGCSVGLNVNAQKITFIDKNEYLINILKTIHHYDINRFLSKVFDIIEKYNLSNTILNGCEYYKNYIVDNSGLKYYNREGFLKLRSFFNKNIFENYFEQSLYLYILICFCFNNDSRFNSKNQFNMPIGKTDFNKHKLEKLKSFKNGISNKKVEFIMSDIDIIKELKYQTNDFVYVDPPYLITNAVYNENGGWNEVMEKKLLNHLSFLNSKNIKFALSNVLEKNNSENKILKNWVKENNFNIFNIKYDYISSSYNKKDRYANEMEVLITNYDV